mmetsp:Transcript_68593/g.135670  ORF Transcript_68593/g.135670 Transcript_68593/m.135670 type:complete len:776 (+) Transcript_68593:51-2378(+)
MAGCSQPVRSGTEHAKTRSVAPRAFTTAPDMQTQPKGQDGGSASQGPKIVGPNIQGTKEEYRLERRLQNGLFGGVYEARGLSTGRAFAVKVLHQSEILKAQQADSIEFCEVPLSEIGFIDLMKGSDHVMQVEDHFEDQYCHYIVFELAVGGDLLEALKLRPTGFEEHQAQYLIGQAARGLCVLHSRHLAMQDVSLENMLINILDDGQYQIKICDPGQAVVFQTDKDGEEIPVEFQGFVGKSFRPPELHQKKPYLATKVDAWCLGWSTFYLLAAQPLFLSADPSQQDADWALFKSGEVMRLFRQKGASCSQKCVDFILRLMQLDPRRRISVAEALRHEWLADEGVRPMYAPKAPVASDLPSKAGNVSPTRSSATIASHGSSHGNIHSNGSSKGLSIHGMPGAQNSSALLPASGVQAMNGRNSSGISPDCSRSGRFRNEACRNVQPSPSTRTSAVSGRAPSRGQAPAWKMAPVSRSESPSPGPTPSGSSRRPSLLQPRQLQASTATMPRSTPEAPRNASPFGPVVPRTENPDVRAADSAAVARQLGTPRRPERSAPRLGHAPRGATGATGLHVGHSAATSAATVQHPCAGGTGGSLGHTATEPTSNGISANGFAKHGSSSSTACLSGGGHRPGSPTHVILRPGNAGRGYSPGPVRSLGPGHYWQSPRPSSPTSTVIRAPEAYPRGRSNTRASSPSHQVAHSPTSIVNAYGNPSSSPSPTVVRGVSPGMVTSVPTGRAAGGFAWSPAPLSPPPNKRAVSPVPAGAVVVSGSPVPRWVA